MPKKDEIDDLFRVMHKEKHGKHFLVFEPQHDSEGYPPKEIQVTADQWDSLRYHFMKMINDRTGEEKIGYVYEK